MCGIVGFNWNDAPLVKGLNGLLAHRGPDQSNFYCDQRMSLAHRRLSILDLSENGIQPMANENGDVLVVFNGEIFNYEELKKDLTKRGHRFISTTDTEVLVHLYEEHGYDMLSMLDGQFSFCIYDKPKGLLFLARDRVGILPLFYYHAQGKFIFCSELKGILRSGINKGIDEDALARYFRFGYLPAPHCILKNTLKLKPAHYLVYDLALKDIIAYERYWDMAFSEEISDHNSAAQELRSLLEQSVQSRLMADVPVGAFLSGGIDSSAVVALMKKHKKDLKTFSVKFDYPEFDESAHAKRTAEYFGTEHYEIHFSSADARRIIEKLAAHYDEPLGDSSAIPTCLVSEAARQHVTVSLSGDGGDELLGGYDSYRYFFILRVLNALPAGLKSFLRLLFSLAIRVCPKFELERVRELLKFPKLGDIELFEKLSEKIDREDLKKLLKRDAQFTDTTQGIGTRKGLSALLHYDIVNYLEGDILAKVDRAAMAVSLETRPPFLDHRVIEFCLRIHNRLKIKGWNGKWILKKAFEGIVPMETLRRKKKGFAVPIRHYLKNELKDLVQKYVFHYTGHDLFDREFIKGISGRGAPKDTARLYWNIMMFNLWHERWMR
ncbi:MAG: asparagine synthase (glutamine-hydrolyzing) [Candidatus Omnitrophica bacterium]|nr:asparagine synthase (glutamine-hydrolyzing) [Candidatus Omnitrophota bacterium]